MQNTGIAQKTCGCPKKVRVPEKNAGTRTDSGTRIFSGRYPQKPETRTIDTRTYPKPDFYARNPSLSVSDL